ncbi:MAG: tetratricopeptide repeat protein [Candidatus Latescibacteria bacterium]|nr:tetratricopeptide repeat protein [Candidatus Latescibacterota bacterium]
MRIPRHFQYILGVFTLAFILITVVKARQDQTTLDRANQMSDERRAQVVRFWETYRRASDRRDAGDLNGAVAAYQEALRLNDRHEDTLYYLGNTLCDLGRYEEALSTFQRLVAVNALSARAHFQAGAILSCAEPGAPFDLDGAEREFQRALDINREESEPLVRLGEVALAKGDLDRAQDYLTGATRLNSKAVEAYYLRGYIRWKRGDRGGAVALFKTALKLNQADKPVRGVLGEGDVKRRAQVSGVRRQSPFLPFLLDAMASRPDVSGPQVDAAYRQLARFCDGLSERWRHSPHPPSPPGR